MRVDNMYIIIMYLSINNVTIKLSRRNKHYLPTLHYKETFLWCFNKVFMSLVSLCSITFLF